MMKFKELLKDTYLESLPRNERRKKYIEQVKIALLSAARDGLDRTYVKVRNTDQLEWLKSFLQKEELHIFMEDFQSDNSDILIYFCID